MNRVLLWSGFALTAGFLLLFVLGPLAIALSQGLRPAFLYEALAHPVYREGLRNSLAIAAVTTVLSLAMTVPLAWFGARVRFRGQGFAEALLLAPLILPPFVGALGVFQLLGRYGVVNTLLAHWGVCAVGGGPDWLGEHRFAIVCVVEALGLYPILYLSLAASFARLDPTLLEAARAAGASRFTVFWRIILPLVRPGLFAGAIVVFVWSFTELGTPLMLGFDRATPVQILAGVADLASNPMPFALAVILLTVATGLYLLSRVLFPADGNASVGRGAGAGGLASAAIPLRGWKALGAWLPYLLLILGAIAPHLIVVLMAFSHDWYQTLSPGAYTLQHWRDALSHPQVVPGIINSLLYSAGAVLLAVALGLFIAWSSVRWRPLGWRVLDTLAMIPLAVPGVIFAIGFLGLAYAHPVLRALLDPFVNPVPLLIIAYAVRRLPHVLRAAAAGLSQASVTYEEAAAACGAGPARRLWRITLPLIAGSLGAGALMTFSFSMLEVSDSLILAQQRDFWPITRVIYDLVNVLGSGPAIACAFATWAMLFLAATLGAAAVFLGKNPTTLFRQ